MEGLTRTGMVEWEWVIVVTVAGAAVSIAANKYLGKILVRLAGTAPESLSAWIAGNLPKTLAILLFLLSLEIASDALHLNRQHKMVADAALSLFALLVVGLMLKRMVSVFKKLRYETVKERAKLRKRKKKIRAKYR